MSPLREAEANVRRMRRWKKNAGPGFRQSADAALKAAVTQALMASAPAISANHHRLMEAMKLGRKVGR